jgi:alpha-galactosidase
VRKKSELILYPVVDDCWSVQSGRNSSTGRIIPDPIKFPSGIDGLATQVHNQGLKIGIYSSTLLADPVRSCGLADKMTGAG